MELDVRSEKPCASREGLELGITSCRWAPHGLLGLSHRRCTFAHIEVYLSFDEGLSLLGER